MVATPYKGTVLIEFEGGGSMEQPFSASDVAGAYVTWDKTGGGTTLVLPARGAITDIVVSADGADTKRLELYVNTLDTGRTWRTAQLLSTVLNRILRAAGWFPAGAQIQMIQRA